MNSTTFNLRSHRYIRSVKNINQSDLETLYDYISEGDIWGNLIDPSISTTGDDYACGNYYCTKREGSNVLLTDSFTLHESDNECQPIVINENTVYGMFVAFQWMRVHKIPQFTITQEGSRYIFTAKNIEPIIIDPNSGNLYNDTIPLIIIRRINATFEWEIKSHNSKYESFVYGQPIDNDLELVCDLIVKNYPNNLLLDLNKFSCASNQANEHEKTVYNDIRITSKLDCVLIEPIKQVDESHYIQILLSKDSLIKFLQAWETRLQFCDSFTLVFLGRTLRFFEGEPMQPESTTSKR